MNISDILSIIAIIISVIGSVTSFVWNNRRAKKQATLEAYNILQEQALDKLNKYSKADFQLIAENRKVTTKSEENERSGKEKYNEIRTLLARCEHFSVGVYNGIYDKKVVSQLSGVYLTYLLEKAMPVIAAAQSTPDGQKSYATFERLVNDIKGEKK